jgi:hypothetical protein
MRLIAHVVAVACTAFAVTGTIGSVSIEDLQYEGHVVVGPDGNGWVVARFPTTVGGEDVTYHLDVWTGCSDDSTADPDRFCPPPVKALGVTLNSEVVFRKTSFAIERVEIALHLVGTSDNEIMVSADGERGAAAQFAIIAVRPTPAISDGADGAARQ